MKTTRQILFSLSASALCLATSVRAQDKNFRIYLLIGQSNMAGMAPWEAQDRNTNARIQDLAYDNCSNLGRTYNKWYTATPPLHGCWGSLGPGDWFGRTMADSLPKAKIGLVPCAVSGTGVQLFMKGVNYSGRGNYKLPPDNSMSGYEMVRSRAALAQKSGVISGILFHQGEADNGNSAWPGWVKSMVDSLRKDLNLDPKTTPFIAGELLYSGCCAGHNALVHRIPDVVANGYWVSSGTTPEQVWKTGATGLAGIGGTDPAHFNAASYRELGKRYARKMLQVSPWLKNDSLAGFSGVTRRAGELRVVREAGGISMSCGGQVCRNLSLTSIDGRRERFASGATESVVSGVVRPGLYVLRADDGVRVWTSKLFIDRGIPSTKDVEP